MPDTGPPHALRFPAAADPPRGNEQIEALARDTAARLTAITVPWTFTAGSESKLTAAGDGRATFTHGGPTTPTAVIVSVKASGSAAVDQLARAVVVAKNATTFTVQLYRSDSNAPFLGNPCAIEWLAIFPKGA